ncbi:hypothetical protein NECID01_1879 [Nematocida sp. AWRm77]|nr:hypothetical protein NECID01_1879 [Nematocida sp. AWRm77]
MRVLDTAKICEIVETWKSTESVEIEEKTQMEICKHLQTSVVHGPLEIEKLLEVFVAFRETAAAFASESPKLLSDLLCLFLDNVSFHSPQLVYYAKEALDVLGAELAARPERRKELLFAQARICTSIPDEEEFREKEEKALSSLRDALCLAHNFTGKLGALYEGQTVLVPVLCCEMPFREIHFADTNNIDTLEKEACVVDRYFLFPKEDRSYYKLTPEETEYLYLMSKHYLLLSEKTAEKAACLSRVILSNATHPEAFLIYAQTLQQNPMKYLMALDHPACVYAHFGKQREYEILRAHAQAKVGGHEYAQGVFQKYKQVESLISLGCYAKDKTQVVSLLETKIKEIREKIDVAELEQKMGLCLSFASPGAVSPESAFHNIELGTHLHTLGQITKDLDTLREAFSVLKIPKHAKTLCAQLLFNKHPEEAVKVFEQCPVSLTNVEEATMLSLSLLQADRHGEAETLLRKAKLLHPTDVKIDNILHVALMYQGKVEDTIGLISARAKTYSVDIVSDCTVLFTYGSNSKVYKYCEEALLQLYRKTMQASPEWMESLLQASKEDSGAKEALLSALSQMNTLSIVQYIKEALALPTSLSSRTEYFARKRLIEDAIRNRNYPEGEKNISIMRTLSSDIKENEDFIRVLSTFYAAQSK